MGTILAIEVTEGGGRLLVETTAWERPLEYGESISVSGVCLSLVEEVDGALAFDVLQETYDKTRLGALEAGDRVNLERALCYGQPLGGHIVTGHVDQTGTVAAVTAVGRDWKVRVDCSEEMLACMVYKGSICLDGISLTIAEVDERGFEVHLIPITWEITSMHTLKPGDPVNLEVDVFAKLVRRRLESGTLETAFSWDDIRKGGFA